VVPLGNLIQDSTTGDIERRMKGALVTMRLTLKRLRESASRGASFTGDTGRCYKWLRVQASPLGHFTAEENLESAWRLIY